MLAPSYARGIGSAAIAITLAAAAGCIGRSPGTPGTRTPEAAARATTSSNGAGAQPTTPNGTTSGEGASRNANDVPGAALASKAPGRADGSSWVFDGHVFAGTYIRLDAPATVTVTVHARARSTGNAASVASLTPPPASPTLSVTIGDRTSPPTGARLLPETRGFTSDFELGAGTYFARFAVRGDASEGAGVAFDSVTIQGATVLNERSDADALAAADTYAETSRRGPATLHVAGVAPGTPARVRLRRHAFHFGANVPGTANRFLLDGAPPGSDASRFQRFLLDHFNCVVPSNAGKWLYNEETPGHVTMDYVDTILRYARAHGLYARMHTMLWDTEQQPEWVQRLLDEATRDRSGASKRALLAAIERRVEYYVRDRARGYDEIDVVNEGRHRPRYEDLLGTDGIARVYDQVARAAQGAGASIVPYVNEYDVLQWSRRLNGGVAGAPDPLAGWYREYVESLAGHVGGVGVQYYADARTDVDSVHSPARIAEVLSDLGTTGHVITLTEFGIMKGASPAASARILDETMRLVFGAPDAVGFVMFGFWAGSIWDRAPDAVLVDKDWNLTEAGRRYEALITRWSTDATVPIGADGTVALRGYYGDYAVDVGGKTFAFTLTKGTTDYALGP